MNSQYVNFFGEDTALPDNLVFVGRLKLGTVVQGTAFNDNGGKEPAGRFGHIVGFSLNPYGDLIMRVQWDWEAPNAPHEVHPSNLILLDL